MTVHAAKAYEVVAGRLREEILSGRFPQGTRLPNETVLAAEFGVSRATVREALRLLAAQNLIHTTKGRRAGATSPYPAPITCPSRCARPSTSWPAPRR